MWTMKPRICEDVVIPPADPVSLAGRGRQAAYHSSGHSYRLCDIETGDISSKKGDVGERK